MGGRQAGRQGDGDESCLWRLRRGDAWQAASCAPLRALETLATACNYVVPCRNVFTSVDGRAPFWHIDDKTVNTSRSWSGVTKPPPHPVVCLINEAIIYVEQKAYLFLRPLLCAVCRFQHSPQVLRFEQVNDGRAGRQTAAADLTVTVTETKSQRSLSGVFFRRRVKKKCHRLLLTPHRSTLE